MLDRVVRLPDCFTLPISEGRGAAMASEGLRCRQVSADKLVAWMEGGMEKVLLIDSRPFVEYNTSHILDAININCSKLMKRRLQQDKVQVAELIHHSAKQKVSVGGEIRCHARTVKFARSTNWKVIAGNLFVAPRIQTLTYEVCPNPRIKNVIIIYCNVEVYDVVAALILFYFYIYLFTLLLPVLG